MPILPRFAVHRVRCGWLGPLDVPARSGTRPGSPVPFTSKRIHLQSRSEAAEHGMGIGTVGRAEQEVFDDLQALCTSSGYI